MRSIKAFLYAAISCSLFAGALAQAAPVTGTVTNKTTGKPAAGDPVVLVEPMAGMAEVAHTTVDAKGQYSLNRPSNNPALVKVTHQGAEFFADAPQDGAVRPMFVYDVAAKVEGVFIEADVLGARKRQRPATRYRTLFRAQHQHASARAVESEEL